MGVTLGGGEGEGGGEFAGGGVDDPDEVFHGDVEVVGVGTPVRGVVWDVDAAEVRDFHAPEDLSVVGVEGDEAVEALVEKATIGGEGAGHAGLAVDAEVGSGAADPLEFEFIGLLGTGEAFIGI